MGGVVVKLTRPLAKRYCEMCDRWVRPRAYECPECGADTVRALPQTDPAVAKGTPYCASPTREGSS